jgi:hypothetical protein
MHGLNALSFFLPHTRSQERPSLKARFEGIAPHEQSEAWDMYNPSYEKRHAIVCDGAIDIENT